ncbi:MAG: hypothetical protein IPM63_14845 [Acidobacteriota bacterium]|nr:MAG: hypothetical protein IPM63_14845 [Acidobacteriota bacterium]
MRPKAKKYLITEESHEILIVRQKDRSTGRGHCRECEREVELVTADAAVTRSGRGSRELFRLIEAGLLHSVETDTGHVLICGDSLSGLESIADIGSAAGKIGKTKRTKPL